MKRKIFYIILIFLILTFPLGFVLDLNLSKDENNSIIIKNAGSGISFKNYTWGLSDNDIGLAITLDSQGNAYVTGHTNSFGAGGSDVVLIKFNTTGGIEWNNTWGGSNNDEGRGIALDSFGNAYVTGHTNSFGAGGSDIVLIKFNTTGGIEWNYTWGGSDNDEGHDLIIDSLNNAYVTGFTNTSGTEDLDICLLKFNSTGGIEWNSTWGGYGHDVGWGIESDLLGNFYICGESNSNVCLVKFNTTGGIEWNNTWGGVGVGGAITLDSLGNSYVAGAYFNGANMFDICLIKFNITGGIEWSSLWGGKGIDSGYGVALDPTGNVYVTGYSDSFEALSDDVCLIMFNTSGGIEWNYTYGGILSDKGYDIVLDSSGNIYLCGETYSFGAGNSDVYLIKSDLKCPQWNQIPTDQLLEYGMSLYYDVNASDPSKIDTYWVNDTENFQINRSGIITNTSTLFIGEYWLDIYVNDTFTNINMSIIKIVVEPSSPPKWNQVPTDQVLEFGTPFIYNLSASDLSGISMYWINDTINFEITSNGIISNVTDLNIGTYWLKISVNDTLGNENTAIIKITIQDSSLQNGEGSIPGFDVIMLIITILGISLTIIYRQHIRKISFKKEFS